LKVAFVGDTSTGTNWQNVVTLIKNEGAHAVVVAGDMSYSDNPAAWWSTTEGVLGASFPVFLSRGNHDDNTWAAYQTKAVNHLDNAVRVAGAHDANYKTTWRGLVIATIKKGDTDANITPFFTGDDHIWKICSWHQNQQTMQVGDKTDEMGWPVYEACRQAGAIIQTGHEHSYHRTKTLTAMQARTVDATCNAQGVLCVSPGRTFVTVSGLGGNSIRDQNLCLPTVYPYGCNGVWDSIYTSNQNATYGAQFITFNVDGNPKKATGYFKTISTPTVPSVTPDTFSITYGP
jgi:hypothetical protein